MTPAGQGEQGVLQAHYEQTRNGAVAYLDETYHVARDGRQRFYVMAAVVVLGPDRDPLRDALDDLVPDGYWHTTDHLGSAAGTTAILELLRPLQSQMRPASWST